MRRAARRIVAADVGKQIEVLKSLSNRRDARLVKEPSSENATSLAERRTTRRNGPANRSDREKIVRQQAQLEKQTKQRRKRRF